MILGVIPARGGSSLKGKNIRPLLGKPLLLWIIEAAQKSKIERLVVSSDSEEIRNVTEQAGVETVVRPAEISGPEGYSMAAINHVIDQVGIPQKTLLLQCTSPCTTAQDIDALIDLLDDYDSAFLAWESDALLWHPDPLIASNHDPHRKRAMRQDRMMLEEAGIYAWRGRVDNRFHGRIGVHVTKKGVDINDAIDFDLAEAVLHRRISK